MPVRVICIRQLCAFSGTPDGRMRLRRAYRFVWLCPGFLLLPLRPRTRARLAQPCKSPRLALPKFAGRIRPRRDPVHWRRPVHPSAAPRSLPYHTPPPPSHAPQPAHAHLSYGVASEHSEPPRALWLLRWLRPRLGKRAGDSASHLPACTGCHSRRLSLAALTPPSAAAAQTRRTPA